MRELLAPYSMTNDNIIQLLFVINIVGIAYVILANGSNLFERAKCIFYYESKSTPYNDRTHITKICNALLYLQTIFYTTIIATRVMQHYGLPLTSENSFMVIGTIVGIIGMFLIIKKGIHNAVNNILFTKTVSEEWNNHYFFTIKLLGFALAPAAITILFIPSIPIKYVEIYSILTILAYLYTIINGLYKIIFAKRCIYVDIFLYLCALDFLPIAIAWKTVLQLDDFITIKF